MLGLVTIDGETFRFMGVSDDAPIKQTDIDINALETIYTFETENVKVKAHFMTPLLPDDLDLLSRPVSYLKLSSCSKDGKKHDVSYKVSISEELCLDFAGQNEVETFDVEIDGAKCMRMGNKEQKVLNRSGDNVRIDWGYVYLAIKGADADVNAGKVTYTRVPKDARTPAENAELNSLTATASGDTLVLFAYDDIKSINYFGDQLVSWWNKDGMTIEMAIEKAITGYMSLSKRAKEFSERMFIDACKAGGEQYAELLSLAYRQAIAAHKIAVDTEDQLLFISKECFSNGCAATVDVSYPSIPMFLYYNPELVKGMMRPIFKFAASDAWEFDFAPHDAGQYPLVTGQVYGLIRETGKQQLHMQMPVEECGNMLVMAAAVAVAQGNTSFVKDHLETLEMWAKYLIENGQDPGNQLCTDDFAGHLEHNCNLSLKAIMGLAGLSIIFTMTGAKRKAAAYMKKAKEMAAIWCKTASNGDGSYRLAFDREDTFSMKYNAVWDKLFGTNIFPAEVMQSEVLSNFAHFNAYGMPLDNRSAYTKSDWIVWTATMCASDDDFRRYIAPLWLSYHNSSSRVPMTDWYYTDTAIHTHFQHRSVIAGLFIKLLEKNFNEKAQRVLK